MKTHDSVEKQAAKGCTEGWRSRGQQHRRWTADISECTGLNMNDAARVAEDREQWRKILYAVPPTLRKAAFHQTN